LPQGTRAFCFARRSSRCADHLPTLPAQHAALEPREPSYMHWRVRDGLEGPVMDRVKFHQQETRMPQNTKDSKGGKSQPVKDTGANGGTTSKKGSADSKAGSPTGSHNKGEKKTTP
jgi:hypothetical protein